MRTANTVVQSLVFLLFISSSASSAQDFIWAKALDGTSNSGGCVGYAIAIDDSGSAYTTGYFTGAVDFDPGPGTQVLTAMGDDTFVSKLDSNGNFIWAKQFGGGADGDAFGYAVAVDGFHNVYATGWFRGTVDFDPGPGTFPLTAGSEDVFVLKLDSAGNRLWARQFRGTGNSSVGNSVTVDSNGNVYATGSFSGIVDFDPGPADYSLTSVGFGDLFVSKLDSGGNFVWAKRMGWDSQPGGNGSTVGDAIAVDGSGSVCIRGSFSGSVDFDPGPTTSSLSALGVDVFVSKLSGTGNLLWVKQFAGASTSANSSGSSLAVDASGNEVLMGVFSDTVDFDPGPGVYNLTSAAGYNNVFMTKLTSTGSFLWAKQLMAPPSEFGGFPAGDGRSTAALDAVGNVYAAGFFFGTVDFDPGPASYNLTSAGVVFDTNFDVFISKLDSSGNFLWAKQLGGAYADYGYSVALDSSRDVYTTGFITGTADFDPSGGTYNLTPIGSSAAFVSKIGPPSNCVGRPNGYECNDGNACTVGDLCGSGACVSGTTITAPPEIHNVVVAADKATYSWSAATYSTQYDVVRGSTGALPVGPGGGDEICFDNLAGTTLLDPAVPVPGTGFWYLSRGENACGIGTYGTQSNGSPRITTTCP